MSAHRVNMYKTSDGRLFEARKAYLAHDAWLQLVAAMNATNVDGVEAAAFLVAHSKAITSLLRKAADPVPDRLVEPWPGDDTPETTGEES